MKQWIRVMSVSVFVGRAKFDEVMLRCKIASPCEIEQAITVSLLTDCGKGVEWVRETFEMEPTIKDVSR